MLRIPYPLLNCGGGKVIKFILVITQVTMCIGQNSVVWDAFSTCTCSKAQDNSEQSKIPALVEVISIHDNKARYRKQEGHEKYGGSL